MKTTTFFLLSIALSLSAFATDPPTYDPQAIEIKLADAINDPALVQAMFLQLDDGFLKPEQPDNSIVMPVFCNNTYYLVSGSFEEWVSFFLMDPFYNLSDPSPVDIKE